MIDAIRYFLDHYSSVKVISISLGNENAVYSDDSYQFRFAATIDEIAYDFRDRNIVFIVSTGNFWPNHLTDEEVFDQYPKYLLSSSEARVIDPATSALAITVGGLCYGFGRDPSREQERDIDRPVAQEKDHPSPFTRVGWGVDGAIKPEVVDYAGDFLFKRGRINEHNPGYAGLPTTNKDFAPPEGRLFRTVGGTSFAAPRVANLAAQLFREFPTASSNLIRALIAHSAKIPEMRPDPFKDKNWADEDILRVYGYGQPDFARARWSAQNDVLLLEDSSLGVDRFQIYTIPGLPEEFVSSKGVRSIAVTLAFDPPTRHTRGDSYLGVTMQFALYRNTNAEAVRDVIKHWDAEQLATLEEHKAPTRASLHQRGLPPFVVDLKPRANLRNKGTLQHALIQTKSARWVYDGGPLILAVLCQRKWAPPEIAEQRFAVVVSVFHEKDTVDLYTHLRQQATVYQRVRIKV